MSGLPPLYIFGASGHAREVGAYAQVLWPGRTLWYVDRQPEGPECISAAEYLRRIEAGEPAESVMGAGRCDIRRRLLNEIRPPFATIVHPATVVMGEVSPGCVIAPGAVIAPTARLAAHVMVNYNATVGHDTFIEPLSVIGPTAAVGGWCYIEQAVYVGAGALIRESIRLGTGAVIGMGSVVTKTVPPEVVVTGMPGRWQPLEGRRGVWLGG